ncbi:MAG: hypothetical protein FJW14_15770 [Acidimicrobiia bacterium]|nr:hypothetical protein [Acidimicrobiia bacterium]
MSLIIDFVAPTRLLKEQNRPSGLPIIRNGFPGTFVVFPGGMEFVGVEDGAQDGRLVWSAWSGF